MRDGMTAGRQDGTCACAGRVAQIALFLAVLPSCRLAALQCPDGAPPPCRTARAAAPAPAANSVAVLYFDNRSRDSNDAYLADGLTEAIIAKLGDVPRLTVKSRFVVGRYRGAAAQSDPATLARSLGVTYLVTGSVQRAGNRLRVTAEMARASSGDRVWGQQYERGDGDVFAIQEDIARGVATGVAGRLLPAEAAGLATRPTRNNEAYDHLLRGDLLLAQRTQAGTLRALAEYGAAVRLDPALASGWAKIGLADALRLDWGWGDGSQPPDTVLTSGLAAADRALTIDSLSSDGWMARGYLMMFRNPRDFAGAEEGLRRAVALNPRNAEAWQQLGDLLSLKSAGHPGSDSLEIEATADLRRALEIEPGRPSTMRKLASRMPPGRARLAALDSVIAIDPSSAISWLDRAMVLAQLGDTVAARTAVGQAERLIEPGFRFFGQAIRTLVTRQMGDSADARAHVDALVRDLPSTGALATQPACLIALSLVQLDDIPRAIDLVDRAPRGAFTWAACSLNAIPPEDFTPRLRRIWEENRPPWAR
jgi:TolB-like protein/Flp pilus assembly protein TadD